MKSKQRPDSKQSASAPATRQQLLLARTSAGELEAAAQEAKAGFKRARKAYRQAKKAAKQARKAAKALARELKAQAPKKIARPRRTKRAAAPERTKSKPADKNPPDAVAAIESNGSGKAAAAVTAGEIDTY